MAIVIFIFSFMILVMACCCLSALGRTKELIDADKPKPYTGGGLEC